MSGAGGVAFRPRSSCGALGRKAHVAVIGAGVFGAWTAEHLRRAGHRVTLVDMAGPANNRASSGGESRMTRAGYGKDEIYSRMALDSLRGMEGAQRTSGLPIFIPHGVLFFTATPTTISRIRGRRTARSGCRAKRSTAPDHPPLPDDRFQRHRARHVRAGLRRADGPARGPDAGRSDLSPPAANIVTRRRIPSSKAAR